MKNKSKNTLFLIFGLIFVAGILFVTLQLFSKKTSGAAVVTQEGKEIMRLDLSEDQSVKVDSIYGGYNIIEIKDEEVLVSESDCDNQLCVLQGSIQDSTGVIICLPHELIITIEGK